MYCSDEQDDKQFKGWAHDFRTKYAIPLFEQTYNLIITRSLDEESTASLLNAVHEIIDRKNLRIMIN
jgi:hypothetical protein